MQSTITLATVRAIHATVGGDAEVEQMILTFIEDQYGVRSLLYLPPKVADAILARPADFMAAVKKHHLATEDVPF